MAMMDDDNISAAITHGGGGGITLHSRWKSQFDDSEGCSDNETEMYVECIPSRYSTAKYILYDVMLFSPKISFLQSFYCLAGQKKNQIQEIAEKMSFT